VAKPLSNATVVVRPPLAPTVASRTPTSYSIHIGLRENRK
jgi:hypothetical protein